MRITENKLRRIIRQIIKESYLDNDLLAVIEDIGIRVRRARGGETERRGPLYTVTPVMGGERMSLSRDEAFSYIMQILSNSFERSLLGSYSAEHVANHLLSTAR